METHAFPIAEQEAKKLDRLDEALHAQPFVERTRDFVRANPELVQWIGIGIFSGLALLCIRKALSRI